jgi:hypothetical protein
MLRAKREMRTAPFAFPLQTRPDAAARYKKIRRPGKVSRTVGQAASLPYADDPKLGKLAACPTSAKEPARHVFGLIHPSSLHPYPPILSARTCAFAVVSGPEPFDVVI